MTFEKQINSLTGLTLGTGGVATTTEATQFLSDGVSEVINRIIDYKPEEIPKFCKTTHDDSNAGILYTGQIYSVVREHDSTTILRPCDAISSDHRYLASDPESIHFRSKYNPGFYIVGGTSAHGSKIYSIPASASGNNDIIVTQVYYDTGLTVSDDDIDNFPNEYKSLVPLYAAIKVLEQRITKLAVIEEDAEISAAAVQSVTILKTEYESSFARMKPQQVNQGES